MRSRLYRTRFSSTGLMCNGVLLLISFPASAFAPKASREANQEARGQARKCKSSRQASKQVNMQPAKQASCTLSVGATDDEQKTETV